MSAWISLCRSSSLPSPCRTKEQISSISKHIANKHCYVSNISHILTLPNPLRDLRDALLIPKTSELETDRRRLRTIYHLLRQELDPYSKKNREILKTFQASQFHHSKPTNNDILFLFNAVILGFQRSSIPIPSKLLHYGLCVAAISNSPISMRSYLQKIIPRFAHNRRCRKLNLEQWAYIAKYILIANKGAQHHSWETRPQKEAWAHAITGWGTHDIKMETREACLFHVFSHYGIDGLVHYFPLVETFCPSKSIVESWRVYRDFCEKERTLYPKISDFIMNSTIQILIRQGDPERAWQIASTPNSGKISDRTFEMLFRHPEHIQTWKSNFTRPAMFALKQYAKTAERRLGLSWTGGKNGHHEPKMGGTHLFDEYYLDQSP